MGNSYLWGRRGTSTWCMGGGGGGGEFENNSYCDFDGMNRTIEGGVGCVCCCCCCCVCVYVCGTYRGQGFGRGEVVVCLPKRKGNKRRCKRANQTKAKHSISPYFCLPPPLCSSLGMIIIRCLLIRGAPGAGFSGCVNMCAGLNEIIEERGRSRSTF
jgi:hypothetical protein